MSIVKTVSIPKIGATSYHLFQVMMMMKQVRWPYTTSVVENASQVKVPQIGVAVAVMFVCNRNAPLAFR